MVLGGYGVKYSALTFAFITLLIIFNKEDSRKKLFELLKNKFFMGSLVIVIIWCYISLSNTSTSKEDIKNREATKNAIIALLIAVMSELHLAIAPFWLVWLASYYLDTH